MGRNKLKMMRWFAWNPAAKHEWESCQRPPRGRFEILTGLEGNSKNPQRIS